MNGADRPEYPGKRKEFEEERMSKGPEDRALAFLIEQQGSDRPEIDLESLDFLTVPEVAGVMRVSKMTVYRLIHNGQLDGRRIGRNFRVPSASVRTYLEGCRIAPTA